MKTIPAGLLGVVCALILLASSGCSDSSDGDPAASLESCNAYCDAYLDAQCPDYVDIAACKATECEDIPVQPSICQTKIKAYYDCQKGQTDVCSFDTCAAEFQALLRCQ